MDYFNILNLIKEPFSNSPDPDFFYQSRQHQGCLQQLEISLRLRRGLNVVIGDVGMGKTTICRQLIRRFADSADTETHLILDPNYLSPEEFIFAVAEKFVGDRPAYGSENPQVKERIKQYLFHQGVDEQKNVILIIDEGQKLPMFCLEILREFLNYETNQYKLLQIVIFAQAEFEKNIKAHAYFADRINFFYRLKAFGFRDTRAMITYRLQQSSDGTKPLPPISFLAFWAIYRASGGYPRKIVNLCHQCFVAMLVQNRSEIDWPLVLGCSGRIFSRKNRYWRPAMLGALLAVVLIFFILTPGRFDFVDTKPAVKRATFQLPPIPESVPETSTKPYLAAIQALSSTVEQKDRQTGKNAEKLQLTDLTKEMPVTKPVAPAPPAKPSKRVSKALYTVQTGAFQVPANARRRADILTAKGYETYIYEATDKSGRIWYTVRIGSFSDLNEARKLRRKLKNETGIASFIIHKDSLSPVLKTAAANRP